MSALAFAFSTQARARESQEFAEASQLANAGQATGYYRLGRLYELGREVEQDLYEAARQYQLAAELGHAESQFALGLVLTGALPDSPRSARKSFNWFNKAAQQGHPMAAYFLAMSYETGVGTVPDGEQAFAWYRRAAMNGSSQAMNAVAHMYATGAGIRLNLANAHAWNQVAGARGFEGAARYAAKLEARMSEEDLALARKLVRGLMKKYGGAPPAGPL
ncbi:MAG: sel1 repeat family protein [Deltaproteobacteria bacterium]|nr:sel1 repeat family protein [Deltaproteobacteria bacterium]